MIWDLSTNIYWGKQVIINSKSSCCVACTLVWVRVSDTHLSTPAQILLSPVTGPKKAYWTQKNKQFLPRKWARKIKEIAAETVAKQPSHLRVYLPVTFPGPRYVYTSANAKGFGGADLTPASTLYYIIQFQWSMLVLVCDEINSCQFFKC